MLKIENLKKNYQQGEGTVEVLKGINLEVQKAEIVAIVGQSGSGKSTLLSLIAGLDRASSGDIYLDQRPYSQMSETQMTDFRAKNIGIVFQQFHLMNHLTALENVMLPLEILNDTQVEKRSRDVLELMGLSHRAMHLPAQLSGGECQRVAIARALVVKPNLLLADEPSGNLDSQTGKKVMDVFFNVARKSKTTTLLVTHSIEIAERCDRVVQLQNGVL